MMFVRWLVAHSLAMTDARQDRYYLRPREGSQLAGVATMIDVRQASSK